MSQFVKETPEDAAVRKELEDCRSILDSAMSAKLPSGTDFHYFKTFDQFRQPLEVLKERLLETIKNFPGAKEKQGQYDLSDPEEAFQWMVDVMDVTLERVDRAVDEGNSELKQYQNPVFRGSQGANAAPSGAGQVAGSKAGKRNKYKDQQKWLDAQMLAGDSLRPQRDFEEAVDNSNAVFPGVLGHWRLYLQEGEAPDRLAAHLPKISLEAPEDQPPHPLEKLIQDLSYPEWQLSAAEPRRYLGLDSAPATYVETPEQLADMAVALADARELAVDLEHHSFRTFQGITCLMQVSDRRSDFLVDTLKLRSHIGPVLAPLFADPQVVKVLHGSDWDMMWLQRDFGIYVANLFDTGQAARVLQYPRLGLAYLLERHCKVKADKRYQLADWRQRPLSEEMLVYARMDTHFLLYVYDNMRNELVAAGEEVPPQCVVDIPAGKPTGALGTALERSRQLSLRRYNRPLLKAGDADAYLTGNYRERPQLNAAQFAAFEALYDWRDATARERDESLEYVLSKRQLLLIATHLPGTLAELKKATKADNSPSLVNALAEEILALIAPFAAEGCAPSESQPPTTQQLLQPQQPQAPAVWKGPALHTGLRPQQVDQHMPTASAADIPLAPQPRVITPRSVPALKPKVASALGTPLPTSEGANPSPAATSATATGGAEAAPGKPAGALRAAFGASPGRSLVGMATKKPSSAFAAMAKPVPAASESEAAAKVAASLQAAVAGPRPASLPECLGAAKTGPGASTEEAAEAPLPQATSRQEVRAVADKLRKNEDFGDYLPLSISERKRRRLDDGRPSSGNGQAPTAEKEEEEGEASGSGSGSGSGRLEDGETEAAVDAVMKQAGLESDSEAEASEPGNDLDGAAQGEAAEDGGSGDDSAGGSAPEPLPGFDYDAARAEAPGLDLNLSLNGGSGSSGRFRGGRGGRRGRGGRNAPPRPGNAFNMYQLDETKFMKGGKRSKQMPRSGNRSQTFR